MSTTYKIPDLNRKLFPEDTKNVERIRRKIVVLIYIIYWLLIFEGVIRKWLFPQYFQALFFIRDPFVLAIYFICIYKKILPKWNPILYFGIFLSFISLIIGLLQVITNNAELITIIYGWRNTFFYLPLAFIIGDQIRENELFKLLKATLIASIPLSILAIIQFYSSPSDLINKGNLDEGLHVFVETSGTVRTVGVFTSPVGQYLFIGSLFAICLIFWFQNKSDRIISFPLLAISTVSAIVTLVVSNSRSAFFTVGIIIIATSFYALAFQKLSISIPKLSITLLFIIICIFLLPVLFPDAIQSIVSRFIEGNIQESDANNGLGTFGRVFDSFLHFTQLLFLVPLWGFGMGSFSNAFSTSSYEVINYANYSEDDWSRNIAELGPVLGIIFILMRITFVTWLFKSSITKTKKSNDLYSLIIVTFACLTLLNGLLVAHGSANGYGWIFTGFSIAFCKMKEKLAGE